MAPAAGVLELIFAKAPAAYEIVRLRRDPRVVGQEPHQALLPVDVFLEDFFASGVIAVGVVVVHPNVVAGNGAVVVRVGLVVRHLLTVAHDVKYAGLEVSQQQFIAGRFIAGRLGERKLVLLVVGQAQPEIISLHALVPLPQVSRASGMDVGQQAAGRVAGHDIGVDRELEIVPPLLRLDAVERFVVLAVGLAAEGVVDTGPGHQIAFVTGINEDLADEGLPALGGDRDDPGAVPGHAVFQVQPLPFEDGDLGVSGPVVVDLLGDVRLELPGFGKVIVFAQPPVELARKPANCLLIADVGCAQAAGTDPAEVPARVDKADGLAHRRGLHRRDHTGGGPAVDHDVEASRFGCRRVGAPRQVRGKQAHHRADESDQRPRPSLKGRCFHGSRHRCRRRGGGARVGKSAGHGSANQRHDASHGATMIHPCDPTLQRTAIPPTPDP